MGKAWKILLISGIVIVILGASITVSSVKKLDSIEPHWVLENKTQGELIIEDLDGMGDIGFTIYVVGNFSDTNQNGMYDFCENTNVTATHSGNVAENFGEKSVSPGEKNLFYIELFDKQNDCDVIEKRTDLSEFFEQSPDGTEVIKLGRACLICQEGVTNITSNQSIWVVYDDPGLLAAQGPGFMLFIGIVTNVCGVCFFLVAIILLIVSLANKNQPEVIYQQIAPPNQLIDSSQVNIDENSQFTDPNQTIEKQHDDYILPDSNADSDSGLGGLRPPEGGL
ncbi:MAG TPA: hypothetical protein D7H86_01255 [Candidatus Poseidoniales archaeon]|nr:MAG TPA: hypothetical protein D7H86_01255 [Candidatus Poseidoniales archaeon]